MDELIADFISETSDNLLKLDSELVELENNPDNDELLGRIFRVMHTIKGTCGFLELNKLASVGHAGENILDKMRSKQIPVNSQNISILLETIDTIKEMVDYIQENDGKEPDSDYSDLIAKINATLSNDASSVPKKEEKIENTKQEQQQSSETSKAPKVELTEAELDKLFEDNSNKPPVKPTQKEEDKKSVDSITKSSHEESSETDNSNQVIRVKIGVLDNLMQIVSELVLNRNQLIQLERNIHNEDLSSALQHLNFITSSIQEIAMSTRMQPISNAWIKFPRLIREMSKDLNKKINLVMIGQETELDKQLIEAIKDPLMHMIRNSADHGLESTETRIASGKPAEGTITLKAYHLSGSIIIEISDDGAGINVDKIKSKVLEKGLASENDLNLLTEQQLIQYIFRAGLSTSEKVTAISGRGVGMDVVKTNIESINGTIEIKSQRGKGSCFILKIPLTLAIMSVLVIECSDHKFGIPQSSILEIIRIDQDSNYDIEILNDNMILRLRDNLLPLVKLSNILKVQENPATEYYIIVCEMRSKKFGLIVDNIFDTEEIVLKSLSKTLKSINVYSGSTLLGNGEIINIISPDGISQNIGSLSSDVVDFAKPKKDTYGSMSNFLILKYENIHKAIPLELVSRLEEIDVTRIETVGNRKVVQYLNSLMYLEPLNPNYVIPSTGKQQVVVFMNNDHILGLIVEKIVDIVSQNIEDNLSFDQSNLTALVINNKTMDIVDINSYFEKLSFLLNSDENENSENFKYKILLVENSPYFRKLFSALIKIEGFNLFCVKNSAEALILIEKSEHIFDIIITEVNIQNNEGFKLAEACKQNALYSNTSFIGLISPSELQEIDLIKNNDFIHNFVSKAHNSELVEVINSLLNSSKETKKNGKLSENSTSN